MYPAASVTRPRVNGAPSPERERRTRVPNAEREHPEKPRGPLPVNGAGRAMSCLARVVTVRARATSRPQPKRARPSDVVP